MRPGVTLKVLTWPSEQNPHLAQTSVRDLWLFLPQICGCSYHRSNVDPTLKESFLTFASHSFRRATSGLRRPSRLLCPVGPAASCWRVTSREAFVCTQPWMPCPRLDSVQAGRTQPLHHLAVSKQCNQFQMQAVIYCSNRSGEHSPETKQIALAVQDLLNCGGLQDLLRGGLQAKFASLKMYWNVACVSIQTAEYFTTIIKRLFIVQMKSNTRESSGNGLLCPMASLAPYGGQDCWSSKHEKNPPRLVATPTKHMIAGLHLRNGRVTISTLPLTIPLGVRQTFDGNIWRWPISLKQREDFVLRRRSVQTHKFFPTFKFLLKIVQERTYV